MPRDGNGVYSLPPGTAAVAGQQASSNDVNSRMSDLEADNNTLRPISAGGTGQSSEEAVRDAFDIVAKVITKSIGYTALKGDRSKLIVCTADLTLSLTAAATLGDGWFIDVKADGGDITIDPDGSENIDGAETLSLASGRTIRVHCDGSGFHTGGASASRELISRVDISSDAQIDFILNNSTYTHYELVFHAIVPSTNGVQVNVRTSNDGGANFNAGATHYAWETNGGKNSSSVANHSTADDKIQLTQTLSSTPVRAMTGTLKLTHPGDTATYTTMLWEVTHRNTSGEILRLGGVGQRLQDNKVDAIRIFAGSGNLSTGTIYFYGIR